jgi:hypothetical protein
MHLLVESVDDSHSHLRALGIGQRFGADEYPGRSAFGDAGLYVV